MSLTRYMGTFLASVAVAACGGTDGNSGSPRSSTFVAGNGTHVYLKAYSGQYLAFNRSELDPNQLVQVQRELAPHEFDALIEPHLSSDKSSAFSVVTGMSIAIAGNNTVTLGIRAREFDPQTGSFRPDTRLFASYPGAEFRNAQEFSITNSNSTNYLLTAMGLRSSPDHIQFLNLQRKSLANLYRDGDPIDPLQAQVILPPGWVAVGFLIKILPRDTNQGVPYISDALIYTALLVEEALP